MGDATVAKRPQDKAHDSKTTSAIYQASQLSTSLSSILIVSYFIPPFQAVEIEIEIEIVQLHSDIDWLF
ncbi:RNA-binding family protein with RRM/RBD/RNP motifs [Prunus dulcis]|uniref:RNA-binding family protein with RRM/RBD/RNP motifs n=1 Tax=Prunus dulcis TaxID=3755 RepID=A0A4Y1QQ43_PRUDU|nr:RNA-binding family protein with RRM/RBD/RNP motifs [Prunus dulcis]